MRGITAKRDLTEPIRGELFAVLTLAVPFIIATIVVNTPIDGGQGVYLSAVPLPALSNSPSSTFYLLVLILTIVTLWIAREIQFSRLGTGLFAIHDDEDVAEVSGVPTYRGHASFKGDRQAHDICLLRSPV